MCKISCPICLSPEEEKYLIYHLRKDHGKFKCIKCDFITSEKELLDSHLKSTHKYKYNCPICLKPKEEWSLIYHLRRDHGKFKCIKCDFITSEREGVQKHMKTDHGYECTCPICFYPQEEKDLRDHLETDHGKFKCSDCDFISSKRENLDWHMEIHGKTFQKIYWIEKDGDEKGIWKMLS